MMDKSKVYLHELAMFADYQQRKLAKLLRYGRPILLLEDLLPWLKIIFLAIMPALAYILTRLSAPNWLILSPLWQVVILAGWLVILGGAFAAIVILIKEAVALYRQCVANALYYQQRPLWHHINDVLEAKRSGKWPPS